MSQINGSWTGTGQYQPSLEVSQHGEAPERLYEHTYPEVFHPGNQHAIPGAAEKTEPEGIQAIQQPPKRILGLPVRYFWIAVFALAVILAAGIGGGLGAGLSSKNVKSLSSSTEDGTPNSTPTPTTSSSSSPTTPASSASASPAPTDGGCPAINGTSYTPHNATGAVISVADDAAASQSFIQVCDTNWPAGEGNGNPNVVDLLSAWVPTLEDCMTLCAEYNVAHRMNGGADDGYCRSVNILKDVGGSCYLKNAVGESNQTFGFAQAYSGAYLETGLESI